MRKIVNKTYTTIILQFQLGAEFCHPLAMILASSKTDRLPLSREFHFQAYFLKPARGKIYHSRAIIV